MTLPPPPDSHRVPLPGGDWALWRRICVRGSGFPVSGVLRLAAPLAAAAADRLNAAEDEAERLRLAAVEGVSREMKSADRSAFKGLLKAIQKLNKGKLPAVAGLPAPLPAEIEAAVAAFGAAQETVQRLRDEYLAAFSAEERRLSGELREVAREGRFREAVLWQNRHVLKAGIDSFLRQEASGRRSSKERQNEQAIASYLQRFCTKNDTIGFFGPVGWGTVGEGGEPLSVSHGLGFLAQRSVFFEGWSVDAIGELLSADLALRAGLAPRRGLFVRSDGEVMGRPAGSLPPPVRALLTLCDGRMPARDLARQLVAAGIFPGAEAVYGALDQLREAGLLTWGFDLPMVLEPERVLRQQIERLEEGAAREGALRTLGEMESARAAVAQAAGDERELDAAFQRLEDRFTQLTGLESTRGHGETYAGRTLVYEDCRRGTEIDLGGGVLAALGPPLSLVLDSVRWLTHRAAELHRTRFAEIYQRLRAETGQTRIDLATYCRRALPSMVHPHTNLVTQQIMPDFRRRWAEVLALPEDGTRQVSYTAEELRPRVRRAFAAPGPGWTIARHHSPDLLIVARGPEAFRRGDFSFVLGELHLGTNTLGTNLFVGQHPSPEELLAAMERDLPEPCVFPTLPKIWQQKKSDALLGVPLPGMTGRLYFGLATPKDLFIEVTPAPPGSGSQVLSVAELSVEPAAGGLQVVSRNGRHRFDLLDFLQTAITSQIVGSFRLFSPQAHLPRVTIDRLILARESWAFPAADLGFAQAATEAERFSGARHWADGAGMPRFLFVKTPYERKPFYLDLASPLSVEIFSREVRRAVDRSQGGPASIRLSEMVPEPEETWLPDREGNLYTSELRMVAVDLAKG